MFAVTGITGQVGGATARALFEAGQPVRAVVRSAEKAAPYAARGGAVALADFADPQSLARAFAGTQGVFILLPPIFDPSPGFPEVRTLIANIRQAVAAGRPGKLVCLSTIGAQAHQENLLSQLGLMEQGLADLPCPVTFLRPAWFLENAAWDVPSARAEGIISSFLHPLDAAFPMVATDDVGRVAAELLQQTWDGHRVVELEGPRRVSPHALAAAFSHALGRSVTAKPVPRESWAGLFSAQGMKNPQPRMRMLDGFNEGWITFEKPDSVMKGRIGIDAVIEKLLAA